MEIDLDEMDLTKAESKATYAEIKEYVLEKHRLKVSQLYIAQVKRKHGIIERVNYNVGEGKAKVPQVPMEKEKAIEEALRSAGGVLTRRFLWAYGAVLSRDG